MNMNTLIENCNSENFLSNRVLIVEIVLLLYGVILLIFPAVALSLSVGLIGILMVVAGAGCGVWFVMHRADGNYPILVFALIGVIVGILVIAFRGVISLVLFPILLGLWVLFTAVLAAFSALGNYRLGNGLWWIPALAAVVAVVVTVVVFLNLSGTERFVSRILGIYFITYNIIRLGEFFAMRFMPQNTNTRRKGKKSSSSRHREKKEKEEFSDNYDSYSSRDSYNYEEDDDYLRYRREREERYRDYDNGRY